MIDKLIKIVLLGGLTNGRIVYDYLSKNKYVNLSLVVTFPDDYSGARHVKFPDADNILKANSICEYRDAIFKAKPDLIIVAGLSELIPPDILNLPRMGVVGFHPSKLPYDRGRSVLAWQIEDGYTSTALTLFKYCDFPDGGDILAQEIIYINQNDYINDILDKIDVATKNIMHSYFPLLRKGLLKPRIQNLSEGSIRRLRNIDDSQINWDRNSIDIYNKIRAISHPYPGAITEINNKKCIIWRSAIINDFIFDCQVSPGTCVAKCYDGSIVVKTRDSYIRLVDIEWL